MDRSAAVARIKEGLGFRKSLDTTIVSRLQEAQRDLEKGKTLPKFLIKEDQSVSLLAGTHTVAIPSDFLREDDNSRLHYTPANTNKPRFLERRNYTDAVIANIRTNSASTAPSVYAIRKSVIDFIVNADIAYTLTWNYYAKAVVLTSNVENEWLKDDNMPEWLIGEAGYRIAKDLRDQTAMQLFNDMRTQGRAAIFGETIIDELEEGPLQMGADL